MHSQGYATRQRAAPVSSSRAPLAAYVALRIARPEWLLLVVIAGPTVLGAGPAGVPARVIAGVAVATLVDGLAHA